MIGISKKYRHSGFVLLMVLLILSALILMVINLLETVQAERGLSDDTLHKVRSRLLARSGVEYAVAVLRQKRLTDSFEFTARYPLGVGSYAGDGDDFELTISDSSRKININDGIKSGRMEALSDSQRLDSPGGRTMDAGDWSYDASKIDPWPTAISQDNLKNPDKSGLANLRLRRLLNAYGDVHSAQAHELYVFDANNNLTLFADGAIPPSFKMTSSAIGPRGDSVDTVETDLGVVAGGLGDMIISNRPSQGYRRLRDVKEVVNAWAASNNVGGFTKIPSTYYLDHISFYEKVTEDLTILAFEDDKFFRLRTETAATYDPTQVDVDNSTVSPHMWLYQNNHKDPRFYPNYLDRFPVNLTDDSGNSTRDPQNPLVTIDVDNKLWAPHSVSLINLNACRPEVAAAIFYAPVNVSYSCEGANTHTIYSQPYNVLSSGWTEPAQADNVLRTDMGLGRSSIGVRGPSFEAFRMRENGVQDIDDLINVQANRLMSLKDAMLLTEGLMAHRALKDLYNFDDFKTFLRDYRKDTRMADPTAEIYERAHKIPLVASGTSKGTIDFDSGTDTLYYNGDPNKKIRALFHDNSNEFDTEIMWISQYWPEGGAVGDWAGGWFLEDYVERTLPHIFSCVRRIPGYLGAPLALTSPYMILEPYAYVDPNGITARDALTSNGYSLGATDFTTFPECYAQLGRQPKISVEDLVSRHAIPKVCFLPTGIVNVVSIGRVDSPKNELVAQTTIEVILQIFETRHYRSQADFVALMARDVVTDKIAIVSNNDAGKTHEDILMGPEFKVIDLSLSEPELSAFENRVQNKYWLALGLADANSKAGKKYSSGQLSGQPYMPSNPASQPHPDGSGSADPVKAWDLFLESDPRHVEGGLNQSPTVTTILPAYGSDSWEALTLIDSRAYQTPQRQDSTGAWFSIFALNTLDHLYTQAASKPAGLPNKLPSAYDPETDQNISTENMTLHPSWNNGLYKEEFQRKQEGRLLLPHGMEGVKENGRMEDSSNYLWTGAGNAGDGHDLDPFGGGLFFSSSSNGEWASEDPNPDPESTPMYLPNNFRDTLFWQLNNKLKNFSTLADVDGDGVVNLQGDDVNNNGILDVYDFEEPSGFPFSQAEGDVNPAGIGFHRGFSAAWFRVPTSYPFPHPVYFTNNNWFAANANKHNDLYNKNKLFKTIMSLHLFHQSSWDSADNDHDIITDGVLGTKGVGFIKRWSSFSNSTDPDGKVENRLPPHTGHHDIDIQVGYYSGFNASFGFEHGIVGHYLTHEYMGGVPFRSMSTSKNYQSNQHHALTLVRQDETSRPVKGPFFNLTNGYFWDYDHLLPTPYRFDSYVLPTGSEGRVFQAPYWGGGNDELGFGLHNSVNRMGTGWIGKTKAAGGVTYGPSSARYVPFYHMMWKQSYGDLVGNPMSANNYPFYGNLPINHVMYASHASDQMFAMYRVDINHKLAMNTTPECAPGSWHRIYAFWFVRFNPGQMGISEAGHAEMGDSITFSDSDYWRTENADDMALKRVSDPGLPAGTYPDTKNLPQTDWYNSPGTFPAGRSRYADDDFKIGNSGLEGMGHSNTNGAYDVDGLDQFGIWFRDDSNYTNLIAGGPADKINLKPRFDVVRQLNANVTGTGYGQEHVDWRTNNSTIHLSLGSIHQARAWAYSPASEEKEYDFDGKSLVNSTRSRIDMDQYLRHFPAYRFDSVVDDFIFAYGPDISVPFTGDTQGNPGNTLAKSSYFRGLFHNAYWLSDESEPYSRHPDEVRYDIRSPDHKAVTDASIGLSVKQPHLNLDFSYSSNEPEIPDNSKVLHMGSRIYFPRDTLYKENSADLGRYNYSELRFDVYDGSTWMTDSATLPTGATQSQNHQDYFFDGIQSSVTSRLCGQFQYTGYQREIDDTPGSTPIIYQSTLYNHNQFRGTFPVYESDQDYDSDGDGVRDRGDSFTNIPYIQEISLHFSPPGGVVYLNWFEN